MSQRETIRFGRGGLGWGGWVIAAALASAVGGRAPAQDAEGAPAPGKGDPVFASPLADEPSAAFRAVQRELAAHAVYRASYTEAKQIRVLRRPLRSSGQLVFVTGRGLWKQQREPFAQEVVVTPDGVTQRFADGRTERVDLSKQPVAQAFVEAMLRIASGDLPGLEAHFELFFQGDAEQWRMGFRPRAAPLATVIRAMVLTGSGSRLSTLTVVEASGDVTVTRYRDVEAAAEATPEDEARLRGAAR